MCSFERNVFRASAPQKTQAVILAGPKLVYMANQIGKFFRSQGEDVAVKAPPNTLSPLKIGMFVYVLSPRAHSTCDRPFSEC
jgi:hypothetical protein